MKKNICFFILIFITSCLAGCGSKEQIKFMQSQLPTPDHIELRQDDSIVTYEKGTEKYDAIYEAILENWWKSSTDKEENIDDTDLIAVKNLKEMKTNSDRRYVDHRDIYLRFIYEKEPMQWTKSKAETVDIGQILFMFPEYPEENKNVRGCFGVYHSDRPSVHEGFYTYYFSNESLEALSENGLLVETSNSENPVEIDLQYFSNLTFEEVKEKLITYNNWTHLENHWLGWNPLTKQIVVNHTFSEKASKKEMESARDYWKTMQFINRDFSVWTMHLDIWSVYDNMPKDAEVIIQVYVEDELVSQDIYSDVEKNIIYKVTRYEKEDY